MIKKPKKIFARALDPIHIGAGGYRLGRVDNTIVREPATDIPKIPGTSIAGAIRTFYKINLIENDGKCKKIKNIDEKEKYAEKKTIPLFGDVNRKGILKFYDGHIIFFPVSSVQGTVWITTKELIEYWFEDIENEDGTIVAIPDEIKDKAYVLSGFDVKKPLNLGWLLLEVEEISNGKNLKIQQEITKWIKKRIIVVSDKLFSHIVNDNLEVRTSVKINPETGTAEQGKLFTYEAIQRGTVIGFEVGVDNYTNENMNIEKVIDAVLPYFKLLGMGGMGTRGFGRMELYVEGTKNNNESGVETDAKS